MAASRVTRATWIALIIAALAFGLAMLLHSREQYDTEIVAVPLDPSNPERTRIGALEYRGGVAIPRMGENIGGLSALRWDEATNKLIALTDDARVVWLVVDLGPVLSDVSFFGVAPLLGEDGEPLSGKAQGDSESLTRSPDGDAWLVGFERDHRVMRYDDLGAPPRPTAFDPVGLLGAMEPNKGLETMASAPGVWIGCAQRQVRAEAVREAGANCVRLEGEQQPQRFSAESPADLSARGAVPTDADIASDGTLYILFRSWSRADGNAAAIVAYAPDGTRRELMSIALPLSVDNFEGLAVQEREGRTFLYIVSDDNLSSSQRTLLMKFEMVG